MLSLYHRALTEGAHPRPAAFAAVGEHVVSLVLESQPTGPLDALSLAMAPLAAIELALDLGELGDEPWGRSDDPRDRHVLWRAPWEQARWLTTRGLGKPQLSAMEVICLQRQRAHHILERCWPDVRTLVVDLSEATLLTGALPRERQAHLAAMALADAATLAGQREVLARRLAGRAVAAQAHGLLFGNLVLETDAFGVHGLGLVTLTDASRYYLL